MNTITEKLVSSLRAMIDLAEQEVASLHELGRDDEDTEAQADEAQASLDAARTTLAEYEAHTAAPKPGDRLRLTKEGFAKNIGDLVTVCDAPEFYLDADGNDRNGYIWAMQDGGLFAGQRVCLSPTLGGYSLERIA